MNELSYGARTFAPSHLGCSACALRAYQLTGSMKGSAEHWHIIGCRCRGRQQNVASERNANQRWTCSRRCSSCLNTCTHSVEACASAIADMRYEDGSATAESPWGRASRAHADNAEREQSPRPLKKWQFQFLAGLPEEEHCLPRGCSNDADALHGRSNTRTATPSRNSDIAKEVEACIDLQAL